MRNEARPGPGGTAFQAVEDHGQDARATSGRADILTIGFGTSVAMWTVGYLSRMPPALVPGWLLMVLLMACMIAGGFVAGRFTARGWRGGVQAGLLSAALNLLILGSLLAGDHPNQVVPSALWWLPGSMLVAAGLGGLGAAVGRTGGETERQREGETDGRSRSRRPAVPPSLSPAFWTGVLARVAVAATLLLLIAGGLVTSKEAGLAVVDWPNSFGYNMFLYPLSRMTGGVYYEHAHRLLGSLVGLTTLVLAAHLQRTERRAWLRRFGWAALAVVIVQGVMGGLRVTGSFTLSTAAADTRPSIGLAILHGVLGQMFFGMMVAISVFTSTRWQAAPEPVSAASARTDQVFSIVLVAALVVQLLLGALVRHIALGLLIHVSAAVIVVLIALTCGARAWGLYPQQGVLNRLGRSLMGLTAGQVVLGLSALFATGLLIGEPAPVPRLLDVMLTTAHQAVGAILLACAVALMLWTHRALSPLEAPASASAGFPEAARPVSREVEPYA